MARKRRLQISYLPLHNNILVMRAHSFLLLPASYLYYIIYTTCTFFIQFYNIHVYFHTRCQFFAHSHAACVPRIEFSCDMRTFQNFLYHHYHFVWYGAVKRNICVQKKTAATHWRPQYMQTLHEMHKTDFIAHEWCSPKLNFTKKCLVIYDNSTA